MSLTTAYMYLLGAILCEVAATMSLRLCQGFSKPLPLIVVVVGYSLSFYLLSFTLKTIPVGIAYAIWSGVGIVCITVISWVALKQHLDLPAMVGLGLIMAGVVVINLFSATVKG